MTCSDNNIPSLIGKKISRKTFFLDIKPTFGVTPVDFFRKGSETSTTISLRLY